MPSFNEPDILNPKTFGMFIDMGWPSITASASMPPTPHPSTERALTIVVWLSVPTTESGYKISPSVVLLTQIVLAIFSRLTW